MGFPSGVGGGGVITSRDQCVHLSACVFVFVVCTIRKNKKQNNKLTTKS